MNAPFWLRLAISLGSLALIGVHALYPDLTIDAVTLGLLVVCVLPWLSSLIESAEFPGGWKIKFRDLAAAAEKVESEPSVSVRPYPPSGPALLTFPLHDPNLALVSIRIEIERRLRALCEKHGIEPPRSVSGMLRALGQAEVLGQETLSGLDDLVAAGNRAAHGASVEPSVSAWAQNYGPRVLSVLDAKLGE